jgi:hypothetical protein
LKAVNAWPLPGDVMTILDYIAIGVLIVLILLGAANHFWG